MRGGGNTKTDIRWGRLHLMKWFRKKVNTVYTKRRKVYIVYDSKRIKQKS